MARSPADESSGQRLRMREVVGVLIEPIGGTSIAIHPQPRRDDLAPSASPRAFRLGWRLYQSPDLRRRLEYSGREKRIPGRKEIGSTPFVAQLLDGFIRDQIAKRFSTKSGAH